jgi:hypothetical protein
MDGAFIRHSAARQEDGAIARAGQLQLAPNIGVRL